MSAAQTHPYRALQCRFDHCVTTGTSVLFDFGAGDAARVFPPYLTYIILWKKKSSATPGVKGKNVYGENCSVAPLLRLYKNGG